jgi:hypothetical protein
LNNFQDFAARPGGQAQLWPAAALGRPGRFKSAKARERLLFVNKKKQKKFIDSGPRVLSATQNQAQHGKSFCAAFARKSGHFLCLEAD